MRIAVVHGYFLSDSGSAIYVRELAREMVRQGHEVTLVCQEQHPEMHDFIGSAYDLDRSNSKLRLVWERKGEGETCGDAASGAGCCRLVRPHIGGRLLTYVAGPFPGFNAQPLQDAEDSDLAGYTEANVNALATVFSQWTPQLVIANHLVMQPCVVRRALKRSAAAAGRRAAYIVTIHGSALNFTVRNDVRMLEYAREGLAGATAVVSLSESSRGEIDDFARAAGIDIGDRSHVVPPGVDTHLFTPEVFESTVSQHVSQGDGRPDKGGALLFVGRLLRTKGLQYAVAALPLVLDRRPGARLLIAGDGPMREPLAALIGLLDNGDLEGAASLIVDSPELMGAEEYGPVLPELSGSEREAYRDAAHAGIGGCVEFLGHRPHAELAPLYASADLVLSPSIFPEAFALVSIEAMAAGALPLATFQTGLKDPLNAAVGLLDDPVVTSLAPGCRLTEGLAAAAVHLLDRFPTGDPGFRAKVHGLIEQLYSWKTVARCYLDLAERRG